LLTTAAVMLPMGYTLDNLSLMAMTIAVGFVVDDAIVMVEAIWRHIEKGMSPLQAALKGAREIGFTIFSITVSLIAVFTPLMFMGGVVGRLMREFAVTLSVAVLVSLFLSLTLTPMLCSRFLRHPEPPRNSFTRSLERGFGWLEGAYARGLDRVMAHQFATLMVFIATALLAVVLYATSATGFFPQQDNGFVSSTVITSQNSSFAYTMQKVQEVSAIVARHPDIENVRYNVGNNSSQGGFTFTLRPRNEGRDVTAEQVIASLRPQVAEVVGAETVMQAQQDIQIGARAARAQYQYTVSDASLEELNNWAPRMLTALQALPELRDVSSDQQSSAPSVTLEIDRTTAGRFGISPVDIDAALYNQLGQRQIAQYFTQLNNYRVIMEAPPELQASPELLNSVYLMSPRTGKPVPLSLLVKVDSSKVRSLTVNHQGQLPAATLSFNLAPGVSLGQATAAIQRVKDELRAPASVTGSFQGTAAAFQQSLSTMPLMILAALLAVYLILGVLYESYIDPLTILSTLPSAMAS
jgi:HAE1 family hydrophobic/amphiphilic exporter-1